MSAVIFDRRRGGCVPLLTLMLVILVGNFAAAGADLKEGQSLLLSGNYSNCIKVARESLRERQGSEDWNLLLCQALLETGQYPEALKTMSAALAQNPWSIRLRWQAREVYRSNGQTNKADQMAQEIVQFVGGNPRNYRDVPSLVTFGQAALLVGADPKLVLDTIYGTAKKADPNLRDVDIASGDLALRKHAFARAAEKFSEALKQRPEDPELHYGLARAYSESDPDLMAESLEAALDRNTNHVGSLLLLVDHS